MTPTSPNPPHPILLPDLKKDTLVGDGLKEYPKIAKSINMDFHPMCIPQIIRTYPRNIKTSKKTYPIK